MGPRPQVTLRATAVWLKPGHVRGLAATEDRVCLLLGSWREGEGRGGHRKGGLPPLLSTLPTYLLILSPWYLFILPAATVRESPWLPPSYPWILKEGARARWGPCSQT